MSHALLSRLNDRVWTLAIGDGLTIRVRSVDARLRWMFTELLVTPENGTGQTWVPLSILTELSEGTTDEK